MYAPEYCVVLGRALRLLRLLRKSSTLHYSLFEAAQPAALAVDGELWPDIDTTLIQAHEALHDLQKTYASLCYLSLHMPFRSLR